jgi:hypothetical protein
MVVPSENALFMKRHQALFKVPDHKHSAAKIQKFVARQFRQHDFHLVKKAGACQRISAGRSHAD